MPTAKDVAQKVNALTVDWAGFLAEVHKRINAIDSETTGILNSITNTLAVPSPYMTDKQRIDWVLNTLNQTKPKISQEIQALRQLVTPY